MSKSAQPEVEFPTVYATGVTIHFLKQRTHPEMEETRALASDMIQWLERARLHSHPDMACLMNAVLVEKIKSLCRLPNSTNPSLLVEEAYGNSSGGMRITQAPRCVWQGTWERPRPPLTREAALGAYVWALEHVSRQQQGQLALIDAGFSEKLPEARPQYLDVPLKGEKVWVRPADALKAALYHNLLTFYVIAWYISKPDGKLHEEVLKLVNGWESKLFAV
jgi:hypothetical protein